jgi:hypothetical protein
LLGISSFVQKIPTSLCKYAQQSTSKSLCEDRLAFSCENAIKQAIYTAFSHENAKQSSAEHFRTKMLNSPLQSIFALFSILRVLDFVSQGSQITDLVGVLNGCMIC